jgi:hypothetical protein
MIVPSYCPCGGIGRRAGFKIQYPLDVSVRVRPGAPLKSIKLLIYNCYLSKYQIISTFLSPFL